MPHEISKRLANELKRAGRKEIGGLLLGEHTGGETFKIVEITLQTGRGTTSHFERDPESHRQQLDAFFHPTGNDCARFNYFGEWHSHPSFAPLPSSTDLESMETILADESVGANFLVLLIVRLVRGEGLAMSATVCTRSTHRVPAQIFKELQTIPGGPIRRIRML